ncbi:hypothetical protein BABINDRAFT_162350 [Babjeviella inositovora NRRL Y-12698]|uniref:Uncharacterized protein n=1 Tax=Babjeviella inositovora NRRL Y-12698 TaxID=984486 RepID=A0A1E3QLT2_9ASCO|nr:uncharacterized protein BABINDRAFT_162350 [Babjeviella inositovora NRRL Y-12698]ODQ78645.1 hypothetical protein BABINDRAFT_162350 [Babjeviella inositovora NRRL Y-12698]
MGMNRFLVIPTTRLAPVGVSVRLRMGRNGNPGLGVLSGDETAAQSGTPGELERAHRSKSDKRFGGG